ncbi:MAG: hypothetical protein IPO87_04595 [Flavobacteriales bacterium]|nr:hypothetical protein [Flavobacteriales bacterium]
MKTHVLLPACGAFLALLPIALLAQEGSTPGGQYYIHGIFNPTIADVQKVDRRPQALDTVLPERVVTYQVIPTQAHLPIKVDSIAPAKLGISQTNERLYKGYAKLGYGIFNTPLGEVYYDQGRSKKNSYGIHLKHMSSNGGLKDVGYSGYSFNNADAFYTRLLRNHAVTLRADYASRRQLLRLPRGRLRHAGPTRAR